MISAVPLWRETKASLLPSGTSMVLVKPSFSSQNGRTGSISLTKRTGVIFLTMGIAPFGFRRSREPKDKGVETEPRTGVKCAMAKVKRILEGGVMEAQRRLQDLISVGPAMLRDFETLGIRSVKDLAKQEPKRMYGKLQRLKGQRQDICVLDVFEAAVAQARNPRLAAEKCEWWWWSRKRKRAEGKWERGGLLGL